MDPMNPAKPEEKYLTPRQTAKLLQISIKTLEAWRRTRTRSLPYCKEGRFVRYKLSDIDNYMDRISTGSSQH